MAITEVQRLGLHRALRDTLGGPVAETLMEHLPPSGWSDVVRRSDLEMARIEIMSRLDGEIMTRIIGVENELSNRTGHLDTRLTARIDGLHTGLSNKIDNLRIELSGKIEALQEDVAEIKGDIRQIRGELSQIRSDMNTQLRWIIGLFAAQFVALATVIFR